jgi:hypothetical protein
VIAHIGGVPVEELAPGLAAGGSLAVGRVWLWVRMRRRSDAR